MAWCFSVFPCTRPDGHRTSAAHLADVRIPMLFLQGTRDDFADLELLKPLVKKLGTRARLKTFDDADHSFHVLKRSGRTDAEIMSEMLDAVAEWIGKVAPTRS